MYVRGKFPVGLELSPLKLKNVLVSNPLISRFIVCGLAASTHTGPYWSLLG